MKVLIDIIKNRIFTGSVLPCLYGKKINNFFERNVKAYQYEQRNEKPAYENNRGNLYGGRPKTFEFVRKPVGVDAAYIVELRVCKIRIDKRCVSHLLSRRIPRCARFYRYVARKCRSVPYRRKIAGSRIFGNDIGKHDFIGIETVEHAVVVRKLKIQFIKFFCVEIDHHRIRAYATGVRFRNDKRIHITPPNQIRITRVL